MKNDASSSPKRRIESDSSEEYAVPSKRMRYDDETSAATTTRKKRKMSLSLITPPDLNRFAICWVKIRGYKDWPGVIEDCVNGKYIIHFFGDYSISTPVTRYKITNFYEGFSLFKHTFDDHKLRKAVQEACICLMNEPSPSSCLVCSILITQRNKTKIL